MVGKSGGGENNKRGQTRGRQRLKYRVACVKCEKT